MSLKKPPKLPQFSYRSDTSKKELERLRSLLNFSAHEWEAPRQNIGNERFGTQVGSWFLCNHPYSLVKLAHNGKWMVTTIVERQIAHRFEGYETPEAAYIAWRFSKPDRI